MRLIPPLVPSGHGGYCYAEGYPEEIPDLPLEDLLSEFVCFTISRKTIGLVIHSQTRAKELGLVFPIGNKPILEGLENSTWENIDTGKEEKRFCYDWVPIGHHIDGWMRRS